MLGSLCLKTRPAVARINYGYFVLDSFSDLNILSVFIDVKMYIVIVCSK